MQRGNQNACLLYLNRLRSQQRIFGRRQSSFSPLKRMTRQRHVAQIVLLLSLVCCSLSIAGPMHQKTSCATKCSHYGEDLLRFAESKKLSDRATFTSAVNHAVMFCQRFEHDGVLPEDTYAAARVALEHLMTGTPSLRLDEQQWVVSHFAAGMADCVRPPCAVPQATAFPLDESVARRAADSAAVLHTLRDASQSVVAQKSVWGLDATQRGETLLRCLLASVPNSTTTLNVVTEGPSDSGKSDVCNGLACDKHAPTDVDACTILPIRYRHEPGARGWSMHFSETLVRLHARVQLAISGEPCGNINGASVAVGAIPSMVSSPTEYYSIMESVNQELRCFFGLKPGHSRVYDEVLKDMQAVHVGDVMPIQVSSWSSFAGGNGGGFDVSYIDISGNDDSASTSEVVRRWRLEAQKMGDVVVILSKEAYVSGSTKHHASKEQLQRLIADNPRLKVLLIPTYLSRSTVNRTCEQVLDSFSSSLFVPQNASSSLLNSATRGFCVEPYCARKMQSLFTGTPGVDTTTNTLSRFGRAARQCFSLMDVDEPKSTIATCDDVKAVVNASMHVYAKTQNGQLLQHLHELQAQKVEALAAAAVANLRECIASEAAPSFTAGTSDGAPYADISTRARSIIASLHAFQQEELRLGVVLKKIRSNASRELHRLPQWVRACVSGFRVGEGILCRSLIPASPTERMEDVFLGNVTPVVDDAGRTAMLASKALLARLEVNGCDDAFTVPPPARQCDTQLTADDTRPKWYDLSHEWEVVLRCMDYAIYIVTGTFVARWVDKQVVQSMWTMVVSRCRLTSWRVALVHVVLAAGYMAVKYYRHRQPSEGLDAWVQCHDAALAVDMDSLHDAVQRCAVGGIAAKYSALVDELEVAWKQRHLEGLAERAVLLVASPMPTIDGHPKQTDALPASLMELLLNVKHLVRAVLKGTSASMASEGQLVGLLVGKHPDPSGDLHPTLATIASMLRTL